jgi:hypothetical protein
MRENPQLRKSIEIPLESSLSTPKTNPDGSNVNFLMTPPPNLNITFPSISGSSTPATLSSMAMTNSPVSALRLLSTSTSATSNNNVITSNNIVNNSNEAIENSPNPVRHTSLRHTSSHPNTSQNSTERLIIEQNIDNLRETTVTMQETESTSAPPVSREVRKIPKGGEEASAGH